MKLAITADVHLRTKNENPERFNALEKIFQQIKDRNISILIIAGDLFDREFFNYSEFDFLCRKYNGIQILIIPGNHDYQIEKRFFTSSNIEIIREKTIKEISGLPFLFIPFEPASSIDEALSDFGHYKKFPERWILIGHGDYITDNRELNPYEPGFYMPLTFKSINRYAPMKVFLGHIHKPSEFGKVIYPGSPCGLDITETGKRSFLIYDINSNFLERVFVETEKIYFVESLLLLPFEDETEYIKNKINKMIGSWQLTKEELKKVALRLCLKGYTKNIGKTIEILNNLLSEHGISLYDSEGIDISGVKILKDAEIERLYLLEKVKEKIERLSIDNFTTSVDKILEKSMELIFKG
jgi:DNA repair exonuclease SbcCD nuclease subunit